MVNCNICGKSCNSENNVQEDIEIGINGKVLNKKNVYFFCSPVHRMIWTIESHLLFYNSINEAITHLINVHEYSVKSLEIALSEREKRSFNV